MRLDGFGLFVEDMGKMNPGDREPAVSLIRREI